MIFQKIQYKNPDLLLLFRCAPAHASAYILKMLLDNLAPTFSILATAGFIDAAVAMGKGNTDISTVFAPIALIVVITAYQRIGGNLMSFVSVSMENRVKRLVKSEMTWLRASLSYKHVENQDDQDLIKRVSTDCDVKIREMFQNLLAIAGFIVQIGGFVYILIAHVWWAVIALGVFCVPLFYLGIRSGKTRYEADREMTKKDRRYEYLSGVLTGRDSIEERYIFGYAGHLNNQYNEHYEFARLFRKKVDKKNYIRMKGGGLLLTAATLAMSVVLLFPAVSGELSIGLFVSLVSSLSGLVNMLSWSLNYQLSELAKNREYLRDLSKYMELDFVPDVLSLPAHPPEPFESLEFKNVSFKYPGTETYILKNMSFLIEEGGHYAVVGVNGAGKTTLTKLITGLYGDFEGEILINGKSIKEFSQSRLKSLSVVVYQDFAKYSVTAFDNMALGDVNAFANSADVLYRDDASAFSGLEDKRDPRSDIGKKVSGAAETLSLLGVIDRLPKKMDTHLGKIHEDGVDVSGGEWQRIALARAVASPARLRILDEPTAALDPISESRVYHEFKRMSGGTTTIFISHRLGSTKLADTILVVNDGRIFESGTHDQLMALDGIYADMYSQQAAWYESPVKENTAHEA